MLPAKRSTSKSSVTRTLGKQSILSTLGFELTLTGLQNRNAGYCFVEFPTPEAANKALGLNGSAVPNSTRQFKLNWASGGGLVDRR